MSRPRRGHHQRLPPRTGRRPWLPRVPPARRRVHPRTATVVARTTRTRQPSLLNTVQLTYKNSQRPAQQPVAASDTDTTAPILAGMPRTGGLPDGAPSALALLAGCLALV